MFSHLVSVLEGHCLADEFACRVVRRHEVRIDEPPKRPDNENAHESGKRIHE
jgi:hypothetical protein